MTYFMMLESSLNTQKLKPPGRGGVVRFHCAEESVYQTVKVTCYCNKPVSISEGELG
jgi:hypothetical protein